MPRSLLLISWRSGHALSQTALLTCTAGLRMSIPYRERKKAGLFTHYINPSQAVKPSQHFPNKYKKMQGESEQEGPLGNHDELLPYERGTKASK